MIKELLKMVGCVALGCAILFGMFNVLVDYYARHPEAVAADAAAKQNRSWFEPGERVIINGTLEGVVNKECWFSINNYEVRLPSGEMTMARGKEMRRRQP